MTFRDRAEAGCRLAERLMFLQGENVVVVGLPRGGVPVAFEVARALHAPMDVIVVRKLGVPFQPELGMGAIGEGGVRVINDHVLRMAGVDVRELAAVENREWSEVVRRAGLLRGGMPPVPLDGRTAVVVDDGMATGSTARAACRVAKARGAERVILAVPVASPEAVVDLGREVEVVCLESPHNLWAVGQWYRDFTQTSDAEVIDLMRRASRPGTESEPAVVPAGGPPAEMEIEVEAEAGTTVRGDLVLRPGAVGLVIFAHGSGSSRHSPRNRFVASRLNEDGLATLLFDLLTPAEEADRRKVFDIDLLSRRLVQVTTWMRDQERSSRLAIGYFGASTGAAAALSAAAEMGTDVNAVVSRGGRPDLALDRLPRVHAPTLLIVGSKDTEVLRLNREAQARLACESRLAVVPGASHLFEEPGTLAVAANLASGWFHDHLPGSQRPAA